jgi:catechol 2,3-dioxygenase-like lactoylglutathione lyase family enzyme
MIKGFNHVGISVASLDRAIQFYRDVLGMEIVIEATFAGERYEKILALSGAHGRVAVLKTTDMQLELFEFVRPAPAPKDAHYPVSDHGISHFCLAVSGLDEMYERLLRLGVHFHCPPLAFSAKTRATYARDPDGNVFELLEIAP